MATGILAQLRSLIGVLLKDWRRYRNALRAPGLHYLTLCNRNERLVPSAEGPGFRCDWQWTSDLHAPKVLPSLGRELMRRAFADHPIRRATQLASDSPKPEISFLIGHRGTARLPHLLATLESIAGQTGTSFECIVIEQDTEARLVGHLPKWVTHVHTPPPTASMPYCRSWTFNIGVQHARGRVLILHDNDMLVPHDYGSSILSRIGAGLDVVNLKRFIFYLSEQHTRAIFSRISRRAAASPSRANPLIVLAAWMRASSAGAARTTSSGNARRPCAFGRMRICRSFIYGMPLNRVSSKLTVAR